MNKLTYPSKCVKNQAVWFSIIILMAAFGCGKSVDRNAQIEKFTAELENLTLEMTKNIDANPNLAGIAEAQTILDSKKDSIRTQFDEFKNLPSFVFSADAKKKLDERAPQSLDLFEKTINNHLSDFSKDARTKEKLEKLVEDYTDMFKE